MKKSLIFIVFIIIIMGFVFFLLKEKKEEVDIIVTPSESVSVCYQYYQKSLSGFFDKAWLKMNISGDEVDGEYQNLPANTDSKIGKFKGTISAVDTQTDKQMADVWWSSWSEGMNLTEQLIIEFNEKNAVVLFSEMIDRGDGLYVYKDINQFTYGFKMSQIDCEALDDEIIVRKYINDNLRTLIPEEPVLGGSWYLVSMKLDFITKTGEMIYEDGHIQGDKKFSYLRNKNEVEINLK